MPRSRGWSRDSGQGYRVTEGDEIFSSETSSPCPGAARALRGPECVPHPLVIGQLPLPLVSQLCLPPSRDPQSAGFSGIHGNAGMCVRARGPSASWWQPWTPARGPGTLALDRDPRPRARAPGGHPTLRPAGPRVPALRPPGRSAGGWAVLLCPELTLFSCSQGGNSPAAEQTSPGSVNTGGWGAGGGTGFLVLPPAAPWELSRKAGEPGSLPRRLRFAQLPPRGSPVEMPAGGGHRRPEATWVAMFTRWLYCSTHGKSRTHGASFVFGAPSFLCFFFFLL